MSEPIALRLDKLRDLLSSLPESLPDSEGTHYPFLGYTPNPQWVDFTGTPQGALNRALEHAFGNRNERISTGQTPVEFSCRGPDLLAVVDVIQSHIRGDSPEDNLLWKWVDDLIVSAEDLVQSTTTPHQAVRTGDRIRKATTKRKQGVDEEQARKKQKANQIETENAVEDAKKQTEKIPNYDPSKLRDEEPAQISHGGRKSSPLLIKLGIKCRDDQDRQRVRCSGDGCMESWGGSRQSRFILPHAKGCEFLSPELRNEARTALRGLAASVQLAKIKETQSKDNTSKGNSSNTSQIESAKRKLTGDDLLVRLICSEFLRPKLVNSKAFRAYVNHLDPETKVINCTTLVKLIHAEAEAALQISIDTLQQAFRAYVNHLDPETKVINCTTLVKLIHAEAEAALQISIDTLQQEQHLSLSFDGATLRHSQSIYTVHATGPDTRQAHLIEGNEASGRSHTAVHIKEVLLKAKFGHCIWAIRMIDPTAKLFSAVSSDSTGNTRLARELLAEIYPWLIIIPDPCHHLNNCAKDIGSLAYFEDAILKLRVVIRYFSKSTFAGRHLAALRVFKGIARGLVKPVKVRFLTIYHAIHTFLPCLPPILELIESKVVKINRGHNLAWMRDIHQLRVFQDRLQQLHAILQPLARAVVCLESSTSTPGDIYHLWISIQATLCRLFIKSSQLGGLHLPEDLISGVYAILNSRFDEVFDSSGDDGSVYLTTFMLDFRYLHSAILTRKQANPLSTAVRLPAQSATNSNRSSDLHEPFITFGATFDADLRQSMPTYQRAGQFLVSQLEQEMNSKRVLHIQGSHRTWDELVQSFRIQFIKYIRQLPPFDQHNKNDSPMEYWTRLLVREDTSILAYLAIKLFSILSNSMPDERTGSALTKINSSDRSNQNANMVVAMAQVLQHERRKASIASTDQRKPTLIRFRDIPGLIKSTDRLPAPPLDDTNPESNDDESAESDDEPTLGNNNNLEHTDILDEPAEWEIGAGLDEEPEPVLGTRPDAECHGYFEVAKRDGVDLSVPSLWDLLCDTPDEEDFAHESMLATGENGHVFPYADIHASPTKF